MISDDLFFQFSRGLNPAEFFGLDKLPDYPYTDTSDMAGNLLILYALTRGLQAKHVLEIGVNDGTSSLAFLKALYEIDGHLTSLDPVVCPTARRLVSEAGYYHLWTFIQQASQDWTPPDGSQFDIVLVDGGHTAEESLSDVERFSPLITKGGILLFHDCLFDNVAGEPGCMVTAKELLNSDEWMGVNFPFSAQLGIFRRRADWQDTK
mgnify:CR=1 FL=1